MNLTFDRRQVLVLGAGCALTGLVGFGATPAYAKNDIDEVIGKFTGGKKPTVGKVKLDVPEIAENGNTVPFTISVDSPMSGAEHVKVIHIIATANPQPGVAVFRFSPLSGKATVASRMRLARTQDVIGIAELSDGRFLMSKRNVKVTIGGCGG